MKRYSTPYFEKKYRILFDKLLKKEGFAVEIKNIRKTLGLPEDGFDSTPSLADFLLNKMDEEEQRSLEFFSFINEYENKNKIKIKDADRDKVVKTFLKERRSKSKFDVYLGMVMNIGEKVENHSTLFTQYALFSKNKYLSKLSPAVFKLMQKFWGVDLLDDQVIIHYIEKYLFMGTYGVNEYIKSKITCHNCMYLGIEHFSPDRTHMQGHDKGLYSKDYIFNEETVKMLSRYFNSTFLIIKPYATKELVIQYIEDNWDDLKEHIIEKNTFYKQFGVHPSIIRESDEDKNRLVYELNKLSKKDLLKRYKGKKDFNTKGIYKEAIVSAILEEEYGIKMSLDAVKKSATRFAKSISIQKLPKDIRDI